MKAEVCKAPNSVLGKMFLLNKCQLLLSLQVGIWCVQRQNWVLRVPAGFTGHSSQPSCLDAPGPLHFSCLPSFVLFTEVSAPLSSACLPSCPQPPLIGVVPSYLAATLGPSSSTAPWEQQSMGRNSLPDRWTHGGWAASAELPRKPETEAELPWLPPK